MSLSRWELELSEIFRMAAEIEGGKYMLSA